MLEPEWEAKFEGESFGFRPGRSPQNAHKSVFSNLQFMPKYVLDADIRKCYDLIDHNYLLKKLDCDPILSNQIQSWLKAGIMDSLNNQNFESNEYGTSQGGIISPLLCNIALDGMREAGVKVVEQFKGNKEMRKRTVKSSYALIRYADDFIVVHPWLDVVEAVKEEIAKFLNPINLELHPTKTRIVHTKEKHDGHQPGFNFLFV